MFITEVIEVVLDFIIERCFSFFILPDTPLTVLQFRTAPSLTTIIKVDLMEEQLYWIALDCTDLYIMLLRVSGAA